jgi:hypothetical protein
VLKQTNAAQPLPCVDFTLELFCRVDDVLHDVPKHPLAQLYPSEIVTIGLLHALRGGGWRAFYRWLKKELGHLFPRLPDQSRLFRLLVRKSSLTHRFMAETTALGVCDTMGIELLHPRREGRCWWHFARKGKCNGRWIVGAKFFVLLNQWGQVVRTSVCPAHRHDTLFHPVIESFEEQMLVLADTGFHAAQGDPKNLKLCRRGQWNERMLIETAFSLFEGVMGLKKVDRRACHTLAAYLNYAAAIYNLCTAWSGTVQLSLKDFAL